MSEASPIYMPSPWQQRFHALPHDEALGAGSVGPGKTECLIMEPLAQIICEDERARDPKHPHYIGKGNSVGWALYLRRTMPQLRQTIIRAKAKYLRMDPSCKWNAQDSTLEFYSGYRYQFGHVKDADSWLDYYSNEYTIVMFDELITFTEEQYDQIRSRVRTSDPILMKMLKTRAMSNPVITAEMMDGASLNNDPLWVRKRFVEPGWNEEKGMYGEVTLTQDITLDSGEKVQRRRIYLPATLRDNPNKEFVRTTEMNLRTMKPHIQRVLLKGDWFAAAGAYYADEWDERLHVCKPFKIPDSWLRFRGMDWGFKAPGCIHWWAIDEDGNMFCERELYFKGLTAAKVAARVKDAEIDLGLWDKSSDRSKITGPADTQLWEKRGSTAMSMAEEFLMAGVPWVKADKSSRARNAQLLSKRLSDHQNKTTQPGIVFFRTCKKAIQTIPVVIADPKMPDQPLDGGDDHALDEILYSCAFASRGRVGIPAKRQEMKYDDEVEPSRGSSGYGNMY